MLSRFSRRFSRRFCSSSADPHASLRSAATECWDSIIDAEWVDNDEPIPEINEAESVIDRYRNVYSGTQDSLYTSMANLYMAKEAAIAVQVYADHIEHIMREHMSMTGPLGNETTIPEGQEKPIIDMLHEYVEFVNSVENERIQRKVEDQLGRKMILLRMQLSVDNFSSSFSPVACDRLVIDIKSPSTVKKD